MTDEAKQMLDCPFESKMDKTANCWLWIGAKTTKGYGSYKGRLAHRVSYEKYIGEIPEGLTLDHLCMNRCCVNPSHLEPCTQYENNMRGNTPTAINKRKTICKHGHPLDGPHIKIVIRKDGVRRRCLLCEKIYDNRRKENGTR